MDEALKETFANIINGKNIINIFLHDFPDPDCIGASMALKKLINTVWPAKDELLDILGL